MSIDTNVIMENLTELLTNTVNMTSVYYDIFLNPEPMDVELTQYDSNNELITVTIPNRAKDRNIALTGEGSPEGVVSANVGTAYVDTDSSSVYFKASGSGNTGWIIVLTQQGVNDYIRTYLTDNKFVTESSMTAYLSTNNYATTSDIDTALGLYRPTIQMVVPASTSGNIALTDDTGYYITITGNTTFVLPAVTDLTRLHKIFVQLQKGSQTVSLGAIRYFNNLSPDLSTAGLYNIMYEYDNTVGVWVAGVIYKGAV